MSFRKSFVIIISQNYIRSLVSYRSGFLVAGRHGENWLRVHYELVNNKYLRPNLLKQKPVTTELNMMRAFSRLNIRETVQYVQSHQNMFHTPTASQNTLSHYLAKEFEKCELMFFISSVS